MNMLNYDKIFVISNKAMRLNDSHPEIKKDTKWLFRFLIMQSLFTAVFCLVVYNIFFFNLKMEDFSQTCKNGVLCVVYLVVCVSFYIMLYHQNEIKMMIGMMERDFQFSMTLSKEDRDMVFEYADKGKWVSKQWIGVTIVTFSCFPIKNIILLIYYAITDEFRLIQLYDLQYPEAIERNKENLVVFLIIYASLMYYGLYASVMHVAFVPLGPTFMLHACGQLELVRRRVERLFNNGNEGVRDEIKGIVKQLQCIYSFVELINESFRLGYELTLKATTIILPITCYEVIESFHQGVVSMEFLTFIMGGTLISSSPCYYSNLLMEKGEEVRMAIYTCGWERAYDRGTRASLLFIQARALRPVAVRTMFRTLCLDALTELFQQSYTIFNLINAVWT